MLIREAFSFWTGHPYDFEIWIRTGYVVAHGTNPYISFWPPVPGVSISYLSTTLPSAAYLPFWSVLAGGLYWLWEGIGGGNRFVLYFLLKQPPIWADVFTAYLLYVLVRRWTGNVQRGVQVAALWAFFPYAIGITAIWGQFDSILVVVLLALLFSETAVERNVLDGIGILVKWLTVIFLPLEFLRSRGVRRLTFLIALLLPLAVTVLVFVTLGWGFSGIQQTTSSESGGGGGGMNFLRLLGVAQLHPTIARIPFFLTLVPYLWVPVVVLACIVAARWVRTGLPESELRALLFVLTLFLMTRFGLNEQYWIYLFAPLLLDVAVFHPGRRRLLLSLILIASVFLIINNTFLVWFATPVDPSLWTWATNEDSSPVFGPIRHIALYALAVVITVSMAQLAWVLYKDEEAPTPWLGGHFKFWATRPEVTTPP